MPATGFKKSCDSRQQKTGKAVERGIAQVNSLNIYKNPWWQWDKTLNILSLYCFLLNLCQKGMKNILQHVLHSFPTFWQPGFYVACMVAKGRYIYRNFNIEICTFKERGREFIWEGNTHKKATLKKLRFGEKSLFLSVVFRGGKSFFKFLLETCKIMSAYDMIMFLSICITRG